VDHPPSAPRHRTTRTLHGDSVDDDYAWMRRVDAPELHDYLVAENEWTARRTAHLADLRKTIFDELEGVLPEVIRASLWTFLEDRRAGRDPSLPPAL
jgi:oligopeptidase B